MSKRYVYVYSLVAVCLCMHKRNAASGSAGPLCAHSSQQYVGHAYFFKFDKGLVN